MHVWRHRYVIISHLNGHSFYRIIKISFVSNMIQFYIPFPYANENHNIIMQVLSEKYMRGRSTQRKFLFLYLQCTSSILQCLNVICHTHAFYYHMEFFLKYRWGFVRNVLFYTTQIIRICSLLAIKSGLHTRIVTYFQIQFSTPSFSRSILELGFLTITVEYVVKHLFRS